jgi:hypothetical protein
MCMRGGGRVPPNVAVILGESKDEFALSNGRRFYAYGGVLGLHSEYGIVYGWDGHVTGDEPPFTAEEHREIADYMIGLWTAWRDATRGDTGD